MRISEGMLTVPEPYHWQDILPVYLFADHLIRLGACICWAGWDEQDHERIVYAMILSSEDWIICRSETRASRTWRPG